MLRVASALVLAPWRWPPPISAAGRSRCSGRAAALAGAVGMGRVAGQRSPRRVWHASRGAVRLSPAIAVLRAAGVIAARLYAGLSRRCMRAIGSAAVRASSGPPISSAISPVAPSAARSFGRRSVRRRPGRAPSAARLGAALARGRPWPAFRRVPLWNFRIGLGAAAVSRGAARRPFGILGQAAIRRQGREPAHSRPWRRHGSARRLLGGGAARLPDRARAWRVRCAGARLLLW